MAPHLRTALAALVALGMMISAAPLAVAGGHMTGYHLTPEHDDGGRSNEPDNVATGLLGPLVTSCNVDASLDGQCEIHSPAQPNPHTGSRVVAPGCTSDAGRQTSGLCFLALQTGGAAGVPGMSGSKAPGAFTPTKGSQVRFLDNQLHLMPVRAFVDHNAKLRESGASGLLGSVDPRLGTPFVPASAGFTAWYGTWQDKNGNGVVDHSDNAASNEFQWVGECGPNVGHACRIEATSIPLWFFPGNHHTFLTPDLPGMTAVCFVTAAAQQGACTAFIEDIDDYDNDFQGDPLLGPQNSVRPDSILDDRTDNALNARHWVMGNGFPAYHYDQSLLVSEVVVAVVNPATGTNGQLNPASGQFRDVDQYTSWNPQVESLLQSTAKPAARAQYEFVRDAYLPINKFVDSVANSAAFNLGPVLGPADDATIDPGFGREPNHAGDVFPGASRGACTGNQASTRTHWGMCNTYAGHQAGAHAFADAQLIRAGYLIKPSVAGLSAPLVFGPQAIDGGTFPGSRLPGDHRRALGPGFYDPLGSIGAWHDKAHPMVEAVFDPLTLATKTTTYTVGKDGWVGNIVNNTGMFRYRGYEPEACLIGGVAATYEAAQCDPYNSGSFDDPQDYGSSDDEFAGKCFGAPSFELRPDGGVWTGPVFVWRDLEQFEATDIRIEDFTGRSDTIKLKLECIGGTGATSGLFVGRDQLLLPLGSVNMGFTTKLTTSPITVQAGLVQTVVDVDHYAAA
jgi:hypothetical protein